MSVKFSTSIRALISVSLMAVAAGASAQGESEAVVAPQEGMRVSIDPVTKQLRPVTAAEAKALEESAGASRATTLRAAPAKAQAIASRTPGARGVRLGEEHMSFSRAAIGADGKLVTDCVEGEDAAHDHDHSVLKSAKAVEAEIE